MKKVIICVCMMLMLGIVGTVWGEVTVLKTREVVKSDWEIEDGYWKNYTNNEGGSYFPDH